MDCQAFDDGVLDLLYDEGQAKGRQGDELRRHAEACSRCAGVLASLRRGRELSAMPPLQVPSGLEARILAQVEAEAEVADSSWWRTLDRWVSTMGSYAMRPQAAMGALAMLTVGMSLLLLRARPAGPGAVRITENGVPAADAPASKAPAPVAASAVAIMGERRSAEPPGGAKKDDDRPSSPPAQAAKAAEGSARSGEKEMVAQAAPAEPPKDQPAPAATATAAPPAAAPAAAAAAAADATASAAASPPPADAAYAAAMDDFKGRRFSDAVRGFDIVANGGGGNAPMAALHAARATRYSAGCGAALPRYDAVAARYVGSSVAAEATWESAGCYREVGQLERARQLYQAMRRVAGYRDRAEKELNALDQRGEPARSTGAAASKPAGGSTKLAGRRRAVPLSHGSGSMKSAEGTVATKATPGAVRARAARARAVFAAPRLKPWAGVAALPTRRSLPRQAARGSTR